MVGNRKKLEESTMGKSRKMEKNMKGRLEGSKTTVQSKMRWLVESKTMGRSKKRWLEGSMTMAKSMRVRLEGNKKIERSTKERLVECKLR